MLVVSNSLTKEENKDTLLPEVKENNQITEGKKMKGTEKQINYANDIISQRIKHLQLAAKAIEEVKNKIYTNHGAIGAFWSNGIDKTIPPLELEKVINYLQSLDDAEFIIKNKERSTAIMYAEYINFKPDIDEDEYLM